MSVFHKNVSSPFIALFFSTILALSCLFLPTRLAASGLPDLGDSSASVLSAEDDFRLGQAFMRSLRQNVEIIEDPELNSYLNSLGYRLLSAANTQLPFNFFIVNEPSINAFAGPGGHIGIHSGLILATESEGELAAVMAHEISHVTQRHLARAFQKASTAQIQTFAAILAAIILGSPELSTAMITTAAAGNIQQQLNFTRSHEREADRVGIDILVNSGFNPNHMPGFFYRLQEAYRYMESNLPELLRTHPVTPSRIADSQNRARQYPQIEEKTSAGFSFMQAKLRSYDNTNQSRNIKRLEAKLADLQAMSAAEQYEYALHQLAVGKLDEADNLSKILLDESKESALYIALKAQVEIAQQQPEAAVLRLRQALLLFPYHPQLSTLYAQALIDSGTPAIAADNIRALIQQQQKFILPSYYQLLAKAESAAERESNAHMALADYYYMIGQTRTAIEQLETALKRADNTAFQTERIKAQLNALKRELLETEQKPGSSKQLSIDQKRQ